MGLLVLAVVQIPLHTWIVFIAPTDTFFSAYWRLMPPLWTVFALIAAAMFWGTFAGTAADHEGLTVRYAFISRTIRWTQVRGLRQIPGGEGVEVRREGRRKTDQVELPGVGADALEDLEALRRAAQEGT